MFDCCETATSWDRSDDWSSQVREMQVREMFERLPIGLSCILLHPVIDTPEIRAMAPDWRSRVADFEAFCSPELREHIHSLGIQLISYQPLQSVMSSGVLRRPGAAAAPPGQT